MSSLTTIKRIDKSEIECDGTLTLTLGFTGTPGIYTEPVEIALVLDHSSSMRGEKLEAMKKSAKELIHMVSMASGGQGLTLEKGNLIGLVGYDSVATVDLPLTQNATALAGRLDVYVASGGTNHLDAFTKAKSVFDFSSGKKKIVVFFTDGYTTPSTGDPAPAVADLKASGVEIFCIGLNGNRTALKEWASEPKEEHLALTTETSELERMFGDIGKTVVDAAAKNVVVTDKINPDFEIVSVGTPTSGTASPIDPHTLLWEIPGLGLVSSQTDTVDLVLKHTAKTEGVKPVNESIIYQDAAGAAPVFADPKVTVKPCGSGPDPVYPDPCPVPTSFEIAGCQDSAIIDLEHTQLTSLGRVVQLNATLKNICPGKRVALGVLLTEIAADGTEHSRGLKTVTVPAHTGPGCQDIQVNCIRFVLPEDLDVSGGSPNALCNARSFSARVMANYIDTDFECCGSAPIF